jgi:prepilin-type processing-associated H-X9-DG protein
MNTGKRFTKIDVLVTAICLVVLAVNLPVISSSGRTHAKIDVCKANLMQLTAAWNLYADENNDKIPGTFTTKCVCLSGVYPSMNCTTNPPVPSPGSNENPPIMHHSFPSWVENPHQWDTTKDPSLGSKSNPHRYDLLPDGATGWNFNEHYINRERDDQHSIACGTLWKYIRDYKIYRCPAGNKGVPVTYVGSDGLNGIHNSSGWCNEIIGDPLNWRYPSIYIRSQIKKSDERIVFIDMGYRVGCSWYLINTPTTMLNGCWSSTPPVRHNNGATFSFADGHTEYHKWLGRAVEVAEEGCVSVGACPASPCTAYPCDKDLFYMARGVCGSIGGASQDPPWQPAPGCTIE